MKLTRWMAPVPSEYTNPGRDTTARVRYPDPLDGRTWDLDGTPRWIAMVSTCCGGITGRSEHHDWTVDRSPPTEKKRDLKGNTVHTSFADAQKEADDYMRSLGWDLG